MSLEAALGDLGLDQREIEIYKTLLSLGEATVVQIAEKSGLKRPTIYVVLERLREKELILKLPNTKKQIFMAKDPRVFVDTIEQKAEVARNVLPELVALTKQSGKPKVFYFEGEKGVIEAYQFLACQERGKELIAFHTYSPEEMKAIPKRFKKTAFNTHIELGKRGVHYRSILPEHPTARVFSQLSDEQGFGWEAKYVPLDEYSSQASFEVYGDLVLMTARQQKQVVIVENKDIADKHRQIFELLWQRL